MCIRRVSVSFRNIQRYFTHVLLHWLTLFWSVVFLAESIYNISGISYSPPLYHQSPDWCCHGNWGTIVIFRWITQPTELSLGTRSTIMESFRRRWPAWPCCSTSPRLDGRILKNNNISSRADFGWMKKTPRDALIFPVNGVHGEWKHGLRGHRVPDWSRHQQDLCLCKIRNQAYSFPSSVLWNSKRWWKCVSLCACVCSGSSVDSDWRVYPDHGWDGFHEGMLMKLFTLRIQSILPLMFANLWLQPESVML